MKVAIYGSYSFGNYGDDVMAIQFAVHLQKLGLDTHVYRLDDNLARKYSIISVDSFDDLFEDAIFCIIGGGGVLIDNLTSSVDREFAELLEKSVQYHCPVFPISIGGEGKGSDANLSLVRHSFFSHPICKDSTVRLLEDVELFEKLGKQATYYPDVLLSVSRAWDVPPLDSSDDFIRVGINLPDSMQMRLFFAELKLVTLLQKKIIFYFIPTYLSNSEVRWEFLPKHENFNIRIHQYTDPRSTLSFLASLDLVISYKLHLGLTSVAVGTPFYSVGGPGKAKAFLREIGAEFAIRPAEDKLIKLALLLSSPEKIRSIKQQYDFERLEDMKVNSWGHMDKLTEFAKQAMQSHQDSIA